MIDKDHFLSTAQADRELRHKLRGVSASSALTWANIPIRWSNAGALHRRYAGRNMIKLLAFTCGWFQAPVGFFLDGGEKDMLRSPVPAYLIDHPKGLALFDTGLGRRFMRDRAFPLPPEATGFEFDESADIAVRLRSIGVDPGKISWIINSHLHADHCGGNASIPNATVIIQRRELDAARQGGDGRTHNKDDFDHGHPVLAIQGEHDLYGDGSVLLFPSYGHTPWPPVRARHVAQRRCGAGGRLLLSQAFTGRIARFAPQCRPGTQPADVATTTRVARSWNPHLLRSRRRLLAVVAARHTAAVISGGGLDALRSRCVP